MKPKPFDALNHFTLPVGTSVSPMSAFWISPRPRFRREAIGRSLLRSFRGAIQASIDWNDGLHRQIWATAVSDGTISSALPFRQGATSMRRLFPLSRAIRVTALSFLLGSGAAIAEDAAQPAFPKFGLLRERDLTPFGFLRLDMRPAHAVWAPPGNWAVEVLLGYQNTWAMSPNVEQYLKSLPGRRRLGPADLAAIRALPGEAYLVDLELGLVDVALHKRLTEHWSVNATFSGVNYSGGFFGGTIESFHKTFGFHSYGRPAGRRNKNQ